MSEMKKIGICGLCGKTCPIQAQVEDNTILSVQKLEGHPNLEGNMCVRGAALKQYVHNKERIRHPMKRVGPKGSGQYESISWEQAIEEIAQRLQQTKQESGAKATVFFGGHPKRYRKVLAELAAAYGSPNYCTESSTCNSAMTMAWKLVCGAWLLPDAANCKTHLIWSASPGTGDGDLNEIRRLKQKGVRLMVVDPRITAAANEAELHLQPYPGTDGALALSIAHVILSEGLEDRQYIAQYTHGFDAYKDYVSQFPPQRGEELTGVPAEKIIQAARIMAEGKVALRTSSCSVVHAVNGVQNLRAILLLLALTGSLGMEGGNLNTLSPKAALDTFHHNLAKRPDGEDISGGAYPVWDKLVANEAQCAHLADVLWKDEPYKVRNLIMVGGNARMWPRADRMIEGLKRVEYRVVLELFWNEACEDAELVLPACTSPERESVALGKNNHLVYIPTMIDPGDALPDEEILLRIAHALDLHGPNLDLEDYTAYLNHIIRFNSVTLDELKANPDGFAARTLKESMPCSCAAGFKTPSGKVEFVSGILEEYAGREGYDPLPVYVDWREKLGLTGEYPFILCTGARKDHFFHSRTYRMDWLAGLEPHTLVTLCPADADGLGVKDGDRVRLTTPIGSGEYVVDIDHGVKPGVVHVYHGDPEGNINNLLDDQYSDPLSGFPGYRSYVCRLETCGKEG